MRSPTPGPSAEASEAASPTSPRSRRQGTLQTLSWGAIGFVCCLGVVLAVMDPFAAGSASGSALPGVAPIEAVDDGFVPPPVVPAPQSQPKKCMKSKPALKKQASTAKQAPAATPSSPEKAAPAPAQECSAAGNDRLERLLKRVRAEEKARKEARRQAHLKRTK